MHDGTYRYTSWGKNTSMDKLPDIIIYNGTYDDSLNESRLSVIHNGKRLLYQKNVVDYDE